MGLSGNLWYQTAAPGLGAPALDRDLDCDLLIVGGGFTGCAAARQAAQAGASVVLCEAAQIGHGGSGRNVGLVNAGLWLPPEMLARTIGDEAADRLGRALAAAPERVFDLIEQHGIDCEATRNGTLHVAHAPSGMADLRDRYRQMAALGAPVSLLEAEEARARVGSRAVHGALHDARAGTIQPQGYVLGLAQAAVKNGAHVFENTAISRMERGAVGWHGTSGEHRITARALLIATNAYHTDIAGLSIPTMAHVSFFQMATAPLPHNLAADILPGGEGCWDTGLIMSSWRRDADGRLIMGAMGAPDGAGRAVHIRWLQRKLRRLFPELADMPFQSLWSGKISMPRDHVPKVLRIGPQGFAIFGYSGRGIGPGTVMGEALANVLLGDDPAGLPLEPIDAYTESGTSLRTGVYEFGARAMHLLPV